MVSLVGIHMGVLGFFILTHEAPFQVDKTLR